MGFSRVLFGLVILLAAGGACADTADLSPPDSRLDTKVTLEVNHAKLEDALKQLTDETGVVFKAGSNKRDWRVRERRVTIHAKDIRLGTLMDEISGLLGYHLSRSGKENEWTYLYWQDLKSRRLEEEMVSAEREAAAERARKLRQGPLDAAEDALKLSPEEALKKKDKDPLLAYLGGTKAGRGYARLLSSLDTLFPTEYALMMRGRPARISFSHLSPTLQQSVMDATTGGLFAAMRREWNGARLIPYELLVEPSERQSALGSGGHLSIMGVDQGLELQLSHPSTRMSSLPMGVLPLVRSDSPLGRLYGEQSFAADEGMSVEEVAKESESKRESPEFLAEALGRKSPTEENPPTDPELTREVEIRDVFKEMAIRFTPNSGAEHAGKMAAEISRAIGIPVLLESFDKLNNVGALIRPGKQPVYKILIGLEQAGCIWSRGEGTLRIRPDDWALRRSYEIPEAFLTHYINLLEHQGEFTLDDVAAIATSLTDDQILNNLRYNRDLLFAVHPWFFEEHHAGIREMLRLYGSLSARQKEALNTESGLPLDELTDAQWERVSNVIADEFGGVYVADGSIRLELRHEGHIPLFHVTLQSPDGPADGKPLRFIKLIIIRGREEIAPFIEARKKAREKEAAEKAGQEKEGEEHKPAPAPTPTPKQ